MSDDLTARILAAIDETEDDARKAIGEFDGPYWTLLATDDVIYSGYAGEKAWSVLEQLPRRGRQLGSHIVRNDPHAVLRRCAADRHILRAHHTIVFEKQPVGGPLYSCEACHRFTDEGVSSSWCETLLAMAAGYGITGDGEA